MKNKKTYKFILSLLLIVFAIAGIKGYKIYQYVTKPNVHLQGENKKFIYIPTLSNFNDVKKILFSKGYILDSFTFNWVAEKKNYPQKVKAGKYQLTDKMNNNELVNLLRSGKQTPVKLIFGKLRTKDRFVSKISSQIEADSSELIFLLNDEKFLQTINKTKQTSLCLFIPNTYEFFWNTNSKQFVKRMIAENKRFWNDSRIAKTNKIGLSKDEVYILASIVEEETTKNDEKKRIAGVYINRLKRKIRLQADPTVKFAIGNFAIKRILNKHLTHSSPYNTYINLGLPPGPICIPSISSIDAVLNYETHNYLYFCAKEDFSGYHTFAKTLKQHNANARKYRRALNKNRIYR